MEEKQMMKNDKMNKMMGIKKNMKKMKKKKSSGKNYSREDVKTARKMMN